MFSNVLQEAGIRIWKRSYLTKKEEDAHWIIICKTIIYLSLFQIKDKITVQIMEYVKQQLKNNVLVKFSL